MTSNNAAAVKISRRPDRAMKPKTCGTSQRPRMITPETAPSTATPWSHPGRVPSELAPECVARSLAANIGSKASIGIAARS